MLNDEALRSSVEIARTNWRHWTDVFEHAGSVSTNPLFANPGVRFASFCKEYSVHRTIRAGKQNEFRLTLVNLFPVAITDDSGESLDDLERQVRPRFGTHDGTRRMISVVSKVAAFLRPERFVAWDRFARKGLNKISKRRPNAEFENYADYLRCFDRVWNAGLRERINRFIIKHGVKKPIERSDCFQRRVLDVALMKCGNRTMAEVW